MTAVLILMVIFSGIALITYVDNTTKAQRRTGALPRAEQDAVTVPAVLIPDPVETLTLHLPEPARTRAWALLCQIEDAQRGGQAERDSRMAFLLRETRDSYLPETLRAYQQLTEGARRALEAQGQPAETLLLEQLTLLEDGVGQTLRHDHAAADRLLTQGRFLRERFSIPESTLRLPSGEE